MGRVVSDISLSLDGFITGPKAGVDLPLGEGGERLHHWIYDLASWRERHGMEGARQMPTRRSLTRRSKTSAPYPRPAAEWLSSAHCSSLLRPAIPRAATAH